MNIYLRPGLITNMDDAADSVGYIRYGESELISTAQRDDKPLTTFYLRLDNLQDYTEITRYTLSGLGAEVGGLGDLFYQLFFIIVTVFSSNQFLVKIISELYTKRQTDQEFKKKHI